jgi:hypothetical protein
MDRNTMKALRLDVRLLRRRGWISGEELARELEALPDAAHKIAPPEPEAAPDLPGAAAEPAPGPEPSA